MEVILNVIVIVMLGFTIGYCLRLNKRIMELRDSRKDLVELVKTFDTTMINTHKSISNLKEVSASAAHDLKDGISKAEELTSDLSFMNDTASKLADRLERMIDSARSANAQLTVFDELREQIRDVQHKVEDDLSRMLEISRMASAMMNSEVKAVDTKKSSKKTASSGMKGKDKKVSTKKVTVDDGSRKIGGSLSTKGAAIAKKPPSNEA